MASYNVLQAGNFCVAGAKFQYRSDSLNCINPRAGSHIKTLPNRLLPGANLRWKILAQERMRSHGELMQFSTMASSNKVSDVATAEGEQLAEVLWVQLLYIDGERPAELYGTIHVTDKSGTPQYIFNRRQKESLSIRPNEHIPVSGPTRAISASDQFSIDVFLKDYDTMSGHEEVSRGQIMWIPSAKDNVYNQPISTEVKGKYGSIDLCYAVYRNAVLATIEVKLINGGNENPLKVYGMLEASNTLFKEASTIVLFNKESNKYAEIRPQQMIPLLRSTVVVPLGYSLEIFSSDHSIAKKSVTFDAATSGSHSRIISSKYGSAEVKVTWSSS